MTSVFPTNDAIINKAVATILHKIMKISVGSWSTVSLVLLVMLSEAKLELELAIFCDAGWIYDRWIMTR